VIFMNGPSANAAGVNHFRVSFDLTCGASMVGPLLVMSVSVLFTTGLMMIFAWKYENGAFKIKVNVRIGRRKTFPYSISYVCPAGWLSEGGPRTASNSTADRCLHPSPYCYAV